MTNIFDRTASPEKDTKPKSTASIDANAAHPESIESSVASGSESVATGKKVKESIQELLRFGYIEEARKPTLFRTAVTEEANINAALEPLDLALQLDTFRGVAFVVVAKGDSEELLDNGWSHPLVRKQRFTLEQSLLIALLRQAFVMHEQESGVGQSPAKFAVDDLLPQYLTYIQDSGSDSKNESRLMSLLDQLKTYAIVSEVDKNQEFIIRPMIAHLANPESLVALIQALKAKTSDQSVNGEEPAADAGSAQQTEARHD